MMGIRNRKQVQVDGELAQGSLMHLNEGALNTERRHAVPGRAASWQRASRMATITSRCKAVISMYKLRMSFSELTWIMPACVRYEVVFGFGSIKALLVTTWLMLIGSAVTLHGSTKRLARYHR